MPARGLTMFNILVVDDSAVDRMVIQRLLDGHENFEIDTAEDGAIALEKIRTRAPDLVLTDMQMPNIDGLQLVEMIRVHHSSVPVILVTGEGSEDLACLALQRGAAGYVPKLRCAELLQKTIEHVMDLRRSEASFKRLIDSSTLCQFEYRINNDVTLIRPLVELAQRMCTGMKICDEAGCMQIGVALEHAISNAICHGN
jgi:CheY-like chemotaxis protein